VIAIFKNINIDVFKKLFDARFLKKYKIVQYYSKVKLLRPISDGKFSSDRVNHQYTNSLFGLFNNLFLCVAWYGWESVVAANGFSPNIM